MTPIGSIRIWWDTSVNAYRMASPYSAELVDALHKVIPYNDRQFDKASKIWTITEKYLTPLLATLKLIGVTPTVITRQQTEVTQTQQQQGTNIAQRGVPLDQVIIQFVKLVPPAAMTKAYRAAAATLHPDVNAGNSDKMTALNVAWDRIQKEVYNGQQ